MTRQRALARDVASHVDGDSVHSCAVPRGTMDASAARIVPYAASRPTRPVIDGLASRSSMRSTTSRTVNPLRQPASHNGHVRNARRNVGAGRELIASNRFGA